MMDRVTLQAMRDGLRLRLSTLDRVKVRCESCQNFQQRGQCALAESAVPKEVQAVGCDEWVWDEIPF